MNSPPLSAGMSYSFMAMLLGSTLFQNSLIQWVLEPHIQPCSLWKSKKNSIYSVFIHALAYLFKDVLKKQEVLSCPLWHKDILILQLPLRRNSFCFRELLWCKVGGIRDLTGVSGATAILSPNHPAYASSTLISTANLHEWGRKGESFQYHQERTNRVRSKRHLCSKVRSEKFGHIWKTSAQNFFLKVLITVLKQEQK